MTYCLMTSSGNLSLSCGRCYNEWYFFFFLMIRRPPRSTPFPTRRSSDLMARRRFFVDRIEGDRASLLGQDAHRSEEHTSELQSQSNLVCRLLLEKKKKRQWT